MERRETFVVGTAGHIDHGKTTLVKALTGRDLDTLPEERERGITIALGFANLALQSGRNVAFVDVPGHERLIRTMIAGAAGVDAVLLCVSVWDGVMPQTKEHLDILGLLGVSVGAVVLTKCDLVDSEMLELVRDDVADALSGTFLEDAPVVETSAETGEGLERLREVIELLPVAARSSSGPFRLPVDRSFNRVGFGVVVTGTTQSGTVSESDELVLLPKGVSARVRGVQVHGKGRSNCGAGVRVALNLSGVTKEDVPRGTVVASKMGVVESSIIDVWYRHLVGAPSLARMSRVRLLIGTAEVLAVVELISNVESPMEGGDEGWVQLRCEKAVVAMPKDRFVLRRESPLTTLGGGEVVDPWAPRVRRRDVIEASVLLDRMLTGDTSARAERAGAGGLSVVEAVQRGVAVDQRDDPKAAVKVGDRVLSVEQLESVKERLLVALKESHKLKPLALGVGRRELFRGAMSSLGTQGFDALLKQLEADRRVSIIGPLVSLFDWKVVLTAAEILARDALLKRLNETGLTAVSLSDLDIGAGNTEGLIGHLVETGEVVKIDHVLYSAASLKRVVDAVKAHFTDNEELTPSGFKELTGLSRKGAIPMLEWLDLQGVTKRRGNVRVTFQ
jgi:selenocysteine-specific elongation factor